MSESEQTVIEVKDLVKRFGDLTVLDGINVTIPRGKITVIMGGSGCGKTTLLRHLIALHQPTSGDIFVDGKNIVGLSEKDMNDVRRNLACSFRAQRFSIL